MAEYSLYLTDPVGTRLATLSATAGFSYVLSCNAVGSCKVALPESFDRSMLAVDRRIEIWRRSEGVSWRNEFVGFVRRWRWATDAKGQTSLGVWALDGKDLLRRRIVAYAAGSAEATWSGAADDVMKGIVRDNLGADASAARDLTGYGFSVQADLGAGPQTERGCAWRNVLAVLQDVASAAVSAGTAVYFDVVAATPTTWEFRTRVNQRGEDHTYPNGIRPVIFGLEFGNLEEPSLEYDYAAEETYVYAGGEGEGEDRAIEEVEDTSRSGLSVFNRCEAFQDARDVSTEAALEDRALQRLAEGRPAVRFSGRLVDTPGTRYGRDWWFGDRVTATYLGMQFDGVVRSVRMTVDEDGRETLDARLEVGL